jgi:hypothetical protein
MMFLKGNIGVILKGFYAIESILKSQNNVKISVTDTLSSEVFFKHGSIF